MSTQVIETPGGLAFAGFYYPELDREIRAFLRTYRTTLGLTDENDFEVHVQLLRTFALMGHSNNTRLDMLATEMFLDSAQLLASVRRLLTLMGLQVRSASPAQADLICKLSSATSALISQFIPSLAEFATKSTPPIIYEGPSAGVDLNRTDQVEYVYALHETDSGASGALGVQVWADSPGVIEQPSGTWAANVVDQVVFLIGSVYENGGEYRVTERISNTQVRVVKASDNTTPTWATETGMAWSIKQFSANHATAANTNSSTWQPWSTFAVGDLLYVMHTQVMFDQLNMTFSAGSSTEMKGVWEYFDDQLSKFAPTSVTDNGSTLTFDITSLLGAEDLSGAQVEVTYLVTGAKQTITSVFSGGANKITTTTLLGQVTPSTNTADYHVTAEWIPVPDEVDGTKSGSYDMEQDGSVTFTLPQTRTRRWNKTTVNGVEGFALRYRIISLGGTASEPTVDRIRIDQGSQYLMLTVTQGETVGPIVIGSSSGQSHQEFVLPQAPYFDDSETIEVDEAGAGAWTTYNQVETFLESLSSSRHYTRRIDDNDRAVVRFGDNTNGKIPPAFFNNVRATWRIGGDVDGNVGADEITSNAGGVSGITSVYNPRPATGWRIKDGGDAASLARLKRDAPGQLRTRKTATIADDVERLAVNEFTAASGLKPVHRAWLDEEGSGLKTSKLVVVGEGGSSLSDAQLSELEVYFNGDRFASPPKRGVLVLNHSIVAVNYQPVLITVEATVKWPGGSAERIRNQLLAYLQPLALKDDGFTYRWDVGGVISFSNLYNLIHDVDPGIQDITFLRINSGSVSLALGTDGLPVTYAANLTVTITQ